MNPQPKIPEPEWQAVVDTLYDIEDALEEDNQSLYEEFLFDLHCLLDKLEQQYGETALITATRGDYCENPEQQILLYEQAVSLGKDQNDPIALVQSLEALCECNLEQNNYNQAKHWFEQLSQAVALHGDEHLCGSLREIRLLLDR